MSSWSNFVKEKQADVHATDTWTDLVKGGNVSNEQTEEQKSQKEDKKIQDVLANISKRHGVVLGSGLVTI